LSSVAVTDKAKEKLKDECRDEMYNQKQVASKVITAFCEGEVDVDIFE
jgi:hypothetical protein